MSFFISLLISIFLVLGCTVTETHSKLQGARTETGFDKAVTDPAGQPENIVFPKTGLSASLKFESLPTKRKQDAKFQLRFWKTGEGSAEKGPFLDPGFALNEDTVHLEMPEHGHGSAPLVIEPDNKEGVVYHASNVYFSMKGDWLVQIDLVKDDKVVDSAAFKHRQD